MDSFEINKILGALLGTCLVLLAVHIASGAIFEPPLAKKPGYIVEVKHEQPEQKGPAPAKQAVPFDQLLAAASAERGSHIAKECELCHNLGKGQGNKIGPNLYGVVGRPVASEPSFNYTTALKGKGGTWTFDALNKWLTDPRADVPGTAMSFAGISNDHQRADVIAYLNSNSDKPLPLPKRAQAQPAPANPEHAANPAPTAAPNAPAPAAAPANPPAANPAAPPAAPAPAPAK